MLLVKVIPSPPPIYTEILLLLIFNNNNNNNLSNKTECVVPVVDSLHDLDRDTQVVTEPVVEVLHGLSFLNGEDLWGEE